MDMADLLHSLDNVDPASFRVPSNRARLPKRPTAAAAPSQVPSKNPVRLPKRPNAAATANQVPSKNPVTLPKKPTAAAAAKRVPSDPVRPTAGAKRIVSHPVKLPKRPTVAASIRVPSNPLRLPASPTAGGSRVPGRPTSVAKGGIQARPTGGAKGVLLARPTGVAKGGIQARPTGGAKGGLPARPTGGANPENLSPKYAVTAVTNPKLRLPAVENQVRRPFRINDVDPVCAEKPPNPSDADAAVSCRVPSNPGSLLLKTTTAVPSNLANPENPSAAVAVTSPVRPKDAAKRLRLQAMEKPVSPEPEILCFRVNNKYTNHGSRFYFIDTKALLEPDGDSGDLLEYVHPYPPPYPGPPVPLFKPIYCTPNLPMSVCSQYSTAAFVGGCLYMIGGFANGLPLEDVYRLDLARYIPRLVKHPRPLLYQHNWVNCKSMNSPKSSPQCVVVEGKIYVFGRKAERVMTTPCVEVYSPEDDKWEQLYCDWPDYATVEPILGVLSDQNDNKHILLQPPYGSYDETRIYTYDIAKNTLTMQRKYQPFQPALGRQHAVVDGILYCYQDDLSHLGKDAGIVGYDLSGRYKWTPIPVFGLWPHLRFPLQHIQLVGIGKDFLGVLWMMDDLRFNNNNCKREYMKGRRELFIMTFKISRLKRNPATRRPGDPPIILNASHVSTKCYLIPCGYGPLLNCLVFQDTSQPCFG